MTPLQGCGTHRLVPAIFSPSARPWRHGPATGREDDVRSGCRGRAAADAGDSWYLRARLSPTLRRLRSNHVRDPDPLSCARHADNAPGAVRDIHKPGLPRGAECACWSSRPTSSDTALMCPRQFRAGVEGGPEELARGTPPHRATVRRPRHRRAPLAWAPACTRTGVLSSSASRHASSDRRCPHPASDFGSITDSRDPRSDASSRRSRAAAPR